MTGCRTAEALKVSDLTHRYAGGAGIRDVSFSLPAGSVTGFIGVNGAGKSTTLKCVLGLVTPQAGEIALFGRPADFESRRRIGYLPEERGLSPSDRAREVIAFHGRLKGLTRQAARRRAEELLETVGLTAKANARVSQLSKGNAQRVQILCALAHEPELLILDEPFSGLDPIGQSELQGLLAAFKARGGSILFSTHSMVAAERLCDRVVVMAGGRRVFEGTVAEAARNAPHGMYVVAADEARLHAAVAAVGGDARPTSGTGAGGAIRWRVALPVQTPHAALIRALADHEAPFFELQPIKADLEGAFWEMARAVEPATGVERERTAA